MATGNFDWVRMREKIQIVVADNGQFVFHGHHRVVVAMLAGVEIPEKAVEYMHIDNDWNHGPQEWENVDWD